MALKILELKAENIKRLRAVEIRPEGNVVILGGANEQGKTSVFDAIRMAIGGAKATPEVPVRRGAESGSVMLDLGDLSVEFWTDGKDRRVVVRNADGQKQTKPQAILDRLYSKVAFDPLEFSRQKPAEQAATLKRLVGLDFADLDKKRQAIYEQRTAVGRLRDDAEVRVTQFPPHIDAPEAEVDVAQLMAEKEQADAINARCERARRIHTDAVIKVSRLRDELVKAVAEEEAALRACESAGDPIDTAHVVEQIKGAESVNQKVRAKRDRAKAVEAFKDKDREYVKITDDIQAIDAFKEGALSAAKWPISGLGFSDLGITVNGLPFEQASKAQRMKISLAIGAALNPELRVMLLEDASLLDAESLKVVYEEADRRDLQTWLERVGDGDQGAIIIEDGMVANQSTDI